MSEIERTANAIKDLKRIRNRIGAAGDRLTNKITSLDAAADKIERQADQCEKEEQELTRLLAEIGSNFGPIEDEVAPSKKGIFG